jgi:hypothetical protein
MTFNRRLDVLKTGRGISGDVIRQQSAIADEAGTMANAWGDYAGQQAQQAIKSAGSAMSAYRG